MICCGRGKRGAYVLVPSVYPFKKAGVAMRESAQMTFV
jgi:hypothetical protein